MTDFALPVRGPPGPDPGDSTDRQRPGSANADRERAYRRHFLAADRRSAMLAVAVFAGFKLAFGVFDLLWQSLPVAEQLLAVRLAFVALSFGFILLFRRIASASALDAAVLAWTTLAVAANFFTIVHRPGDHFGFVSTSPILIILFFAFFRNRIALQATAAMLLVATDAFTLVALRETLVPAQTIQIAATYALSAIVGAIVAWQLETSRRHHFDALERERALSLRLREHAYQDELTGILNRRSFLGQANAAWRELAGSGGAAWLLMLDLDHFKSINDRFGHEVGDAALRQFVQVVEECRRPGDLFGRIGGEEFALFLSDVDEDLATDMAQRIVDACARQQVGPTPPGVLSVSIGVSAFHHDDHGIAEALSRADQALYRAKAQGRARWSSWSGRTKFD
jgi:diguanylate cyclase (GGDEF)-like protein